MKLTVYQIVPCFNDLEEEDLWEKEKMLYASIFSFSHNISYDIKTNLVILKRIHELSANTLNLDSPRISLIKVSVHH